MKSRPKTQPRSNNLGNGFYLYGALIDPKQIQRDQGQEIQATAPSVKERAKDIAKSSETWLGALEMALDALAVGLTSLPAEGPGAGAIHTSRYLREAHEIHTVKPFLKKAYSTQAIKEINLDLKGEGGDPIEQQFAKGFSASNMARVWIISSVPPHAANREDITSFRNSFVFFSREDAEQFNQKIKEAIAKDPKVGETLAVTPLSFSFQKKLTGNDLEAISAMDEVLKTITEALATESGQKSLVSTQILSQIKLLSTVLKHKGNALFEKNQDLNGITPKDILIYNEYSNLLVDYLKKYLISANTVKERPVISAAATGEFIVSMSDISASHSMHSANELMIDDIEKELSELLSSSEDAEMEAGIEDSSSLKTSGSQLSRSGLFSESKRTEAVQENAAKKTGPEKGEEHDAPKPQ